MGFMNHLRYNYHTAPGDPATPGLSHHDSFFCGRWFSFDERNDLHVTLPF
jgi:hypothetical protein